MRNPAYPLAARPQNTLFTPSPDRSPEPEPIHTAPQAYMGPCQDNIGNETSTTLKPSVTPLHGGGRVLQPQVELLPGGRQAGNTDSPTLNQSEQRDAGDDSSHAHSPPNKCIVCGARDLPKWWFYRVLKRNSSANALFVGTCWLCRLGRCSKKSLEGAISKFNQDVRNVRSGYDVQIPAEEQHEFLKLLKADHAKRPPTAPTTPSMPAEQERSGPGIIAWGREGDPLVIEDDPADPTYRSPTSFRNHMNTPTSQPRLRERNPPEDIQTRQGLNDLDNFLREERGVPTGSDMRSPGGKRKATNERPEETGVGNKRSHSTEGNPKPPDNCPQNLKVWKEKVRQLEACVACMIRVSSDLSIAPKQFDSLMARTDTALDSAGRVAEYARALEHVSEAGIGLEA